MNYWNLLTVPELRDQAFVRGDVFGFLDALVEDDQLLFHLGDEFKRLHYLIQQQSQSNPVKFAQQMLEQGVGIVSYLALRTRTIWPA